MGFRSQRLPPSPALSSPNISRGRVRALKFELTVHTALDELRMQMLGTQVLFGFQFQGVFQDGFEAISRPIQLLDLAVFGVLVLTLASLVAPAAQHRLVERGVATKRLFDTANRFAELALATYALAIGIDVFVVASVYWGVATSGLTGIGPAMVAVMLWFGFGMIAKGSERREAMPNRKEPDLHEKIDQMLTEARVILPGAAGISVCRHDDKGVPRPSKFDPKYTLRRAWSRATRGGALDCPRCGPSPGFRRPRRGAVARD